MGPGMVAHSFNLSTREVSTLEAEGGHSEFEALYSRGSSRTARALLYRETLLQKQTKGKKTKPEKVVQVLTRPCQDEKETVGKNVGKLPTVPVPLVLVTILAQNPGTDLPSQ